MGAGRGETRRAQVKAAVSSEPDEPIVDARGNKSWRVDGELHRVDGPAVEYANGNRAWCEDGKLRRVNGPAYEYADGGEEWWADGKRHRADGPAVEHANGRKEWWVDDKRHRVDGPAVEYANGRKEWWIDGEQFTEAEFEEEAIRSRREASWAAAAEEVATNSDYRDPFGIG